MARPSAIIQAGELEDLYINMMLYGDPGAGKTRLLGTGSKTLVLECDDGFESAALAASTADRWSVHDYNDLEEAFEYVRHEGVRQYDWVWIDSGTHLQEKGMDQIMSELVVEKPHRDLYVPDKPEYLKNQNRLALIVRKFKALPINFGMTAWTMRMEDEDGRVLYMPMFQGGQGALSTRLCGYMGIVGYLHVATKDKQPVRVLHTQRRGKFYGKDRFDGALGGKMEAPTIPKIEKAVQEKMASKTRRGRGTKKAASRTRKETSK